MTFSLENASPKTRKVKFDAPPPGKQLSMFGGLDCPAGTRDLFDVDGPDRLPLADELPPSRDEMREMLADIVDGLEVGQKLLVSAELLALLADEPSYRHAWCPHCDKFTDQTADLLPFRCDECGAEFISDKQFHAHRESHSSRGVKSQTCPNCNEQFESDEEWQKHKQCLPNPANWWSGNSLSARSWSAFARTVRSFSRASKTATRAFTPMRKRPTCSPRATPRARIRINITSRAELLARC